MSEQKKQEQNQEQNQDKPETRQIIIETDGNNTWIKKAEVVGTLELRAIISSVLNNINNR